MTRLVVGTSVVLLAGALMGTSPRAKADELVEGPLVQSSIDGVLDTVGTNQDGLVLKTDEGRRLGWKLGATP